MFKTLKYCPQYPSKPFSEIESARKWVNIFVKWYNEEHQHSSIKFVTPTERHIGLDKSILIKRKIVYEAAKFNNPSRWSKNTRNWDYIPEVYLNPGKSLDQAA